MIIEKFAALPPWIEFEGVTFELCLIVNGSLDDVRLIYRIGYADHKSKHLSLINSHGSWENPFDEGRLQGFLFLIENISNDDNFLRAIELCNKFLEENGLKE
jgi:hypothetical protein